MHLPRRSRSSEYSIHMQILSQALLELVHIPNQTSSADNPDIEITHITIHPSRSKPQPVASLLSLPKADKPPLSRQARAKSRSQALLSAILLVSSPFKLSAPHRAFLCTSKCMLEDMSRFLDQHRAAASRCRCEYLHYELYEQGVCGVALLLCCCRDV